MFKTFKSQWFFFLSLFIYSITAFSESSNDKAADLIKGGRYEEAETELQSQLAVNQKDSVAWFNLGVLNLKTNNFEKSLESFSKVLVENRNLIEAANYYSALDVFYMGQPDKVQSFTSRISKSSVFYKLGQELEVAIKQGTDDYYKEAQDFYDEGNGKGCLEALKDSLFYQTREGLELNARCEVLARENLEEGLSQDTKLSGVKYAANSDSALSLRLDLSTGIDNNIFLSANNPTAKAFYQGEVGGQYLFKREFEFGAGAEYAFGDILGITNERYSSLNAYIPINIFFDSSDLSLEVFHEANRDQAGSTYHQNGASASYAYDLTNFSFVVTGGASVKKSDVANYSYVDGDYSYLRGDAVLFNEEAKLNLFATAYANHSGDETLTGGILPYAYDGLEAGLFASYWITKSIRPSVTLSTLAKQYLHQYSSVLRNDNLSTAKFKIEFRTLKNLRFYLEAQSARNSSNYDASQFQNKNYTDNLIKVGMTLTN